MLSKEKRRMVITRLKDMSALGAFVGALAALIVIGLYVSARLAGDRAYREKWKDYADCGWA